MKKRLMILGAGQGQLPAIRRAVELGFYVITVDYLPDNIGHKFSHQYVNCSTADSEGVLHEAKKLNLNGVFTMASDVATFSAGLVAKELGLPGVTAETAEIMSHKDRFRACQHANRINAPKAIAGRNFDEMYAQIDQLSLPMMIKPPDTSGSRGVILVDCYDMDLLHKAFKEAMQYSRSGIVCVEEFLEGIDVSGDAFIEDGMIHFAVITHKRKKAFVPIGHSLPTNITREQQQMVFDEITANCQAVGYQNGPLDFDVMVTEERATVIEMSPRLGGNGIPQIIGHATGNDLISAALNFSVGLPFALPKQPVIHRPCGSWVFGSEYAGYLKNIASRDEMLFAVPEVFEYIVNYAIGTHVEKFIHSGHNLGYVLFDCPAGKDYDSIVKNINHVLNLQVS